MNNDGTWKNWGDKDSYSSESEASSDKFELTKKKLCEIKEGSVILEVLEKSDSNTDRVFHDIKCSKEYFPKNTKEVKRGPYIHKRDLGDLVIAAMYADKAIEKRLRELRELRKS